jgi:hypothetical protein
MWVSLVQGAWNSLVVVPTEAGLSPREAAGALTEIGAYCDLGQVETMDAVGASSGDGLRLARYLGERLATGKRVVVLVDAPAKSMGGYPLVAVAEAALVVLRYGSSLASARSTIDLVGRQKVLGCVALPPLGR